MWKKLKVKMKFSRQFYVFHFIYVDKSNISTDNDLVEYVRIYYLSVKKSE